MSKHSFEHHPTARSVYHALSEHFRRIAPTWRKEVATVDVWRQVAADPAPDVADGKSLPSIVTEYPSAVEGATLGDNLARPSDHPAFEVRTVKIQGGYSTVAGPKPEYMPAWRRTAAERESWFRYGVDKPLARRFLKELAADAHVPACDLHGAHPATNDPPITDVKAVVEWCRETHTLPVAVREWRMCGNCVGKGSICGHDDCSADYYCWSSDCPDHVERTSNPQCDCTYLCRDPTHHVHCPVCEGRGEVYKTHEEQELDSPFFTDSEVPSDSDLQAIQVVVDRYTAQCGEPPTPARVLEWIRTANTGSRRELLESLFEGLQKTEDHDVAAVEARLLDDLGIDKQLYRSFTEQHGRSGGTEPDQSDQSTDVTVDISLDS